VVGSGHCLSIEFSGQIFAENLGQPKEVSLSVTLNLVAAGAADRPSGGGAVKSYRR
jgi:hypothetical protein